MHEAVLTPGRGTLTGLRRHSCSHVSSEKESEDAGLADGSVGFEKPWP